MTIWLKDGTPITFAEINQNTFPSDGFDPSLLTQNTNLFQLFNDKLGIIALIDAAPASGRLVNIGTFTFTLANDNKMDMVITVYKTSSQHQVNAAFYCYVDGDSPATHYVIDILRIYDSTPANWNTDKNNWYMSLAVTPLNDTATFSNINRLTTVYISRSQKVWYKHGQDLTGQGGAYLQEWLYGMVEPSKWGDDSTTGGGTGNFDISTDTIDFPNLPTGSALETGLINMYKCDSTDLRDFGEYLWGDNFFNQISKIFNDPMESFVSLNLFPVTPAASTTKTPIKIGNLFASKSASEFVTAYPLTSQYLEFDCGTVNINEFFGSALDYNPYTQVQIYLPFIGFQNLSVDDIMDGTITLKYHIDLLTGTCTALIKCEKTSKYNLASVLYSFAGSMNMSVPISASTYAQAGQTLITALSGIGVGIATGGTGTAVSAAAAGSAMNMLNAKAQIQRSGGVTMNAGALGNLTPYIIITRPIQHKPEEYQNFKGWENNITYTLSALQGKGYTEIMYTHIEGMTATDEEKAEIESLLKDGVIL